MKAGGSRRGWSLMRTLQPDPLQPRELKGSPPAGVAATTALGHWPLLMPPQLWGPLGLGLWSRIDPPPPDSSAFQPRVAPTPKGAPPVVIGTLAPTGRPSVPPTNSPPAPLRGFSQGGLVTAGAGPAAPTASPQRGLIRACGRMAVTRDDKIRRRPDPRRLIRRR